METKHDPPVVDHRVMLLTAWQEFIDTMDTTGCSDGLAVVDATKLPALGAAISRAVNAGQKVEG